MKNSRAFRLVQLAFLLFLIVATVFILRRHNSLQLLRAEGPIYGTVYHIDYEHNAPLDAQILEELKRVDASLSMFNKQSTVSLINSGTTEETDTMLREIFSLASQVYAETDGAYDVTVAPLVNAWGFGFKSGQMPTPAQVDSIKSFVGTDKVSLVGTRLVKQDPRTMIDFSSIAKGYAVDRVARLFDSLSIKNYMIEIGGEVVVRGAHPEGRPWLIGVSRPTADDATLQAHLSLSNGAMATSGNYRNYYVKEGRRYAHTIDPQKGCPVEHELLSATVLAPNCATADAYATAFMVMGLEKARALLQKHPELAAFLIYTTPNGNYATWETENMKKLIRPAR